MIQYPTITSEVDPEAFIYVFNKLDGSNIRAEWSRKRGGFWKFGAKTRLLDSHDPVLGEAPGLAKAGFERQLDGIFRGMRLERAVAFFEFFGPNSFAGSHVAEPHKVVLIDVATEKGMLPPDKFIRHFDGVEHASMLATGCAIPKFVEAVRNREVERMTFEGVVCKSLDSPLMFKIKSRAWLAKLKQHCGGDDKMFRRLA